MNNRDYKCFAADEVFHVYNRGVNKMDIFNDEQDLEIFLCRMKENLFPELMGKDKKSKSIARRKLLPVGAYDLLSYCLMKNHFHFLIRQNTELPITQFILKVCTGYSKYFNKKYGRVGAVFQDRCRAVRIQKNEQLLWTSFYIHNNPKKAGIVDKLSDYKWGSYLDYIGLRDGIICKKEIILEQFNSQDSYSRWFEDPKLSMEIEGNLIGNQDLLIDY